MLTVTSMKKYSQEYEHSEEYSEVH